MIITLWISLGLLSTAYAVTIEDLYLFSQEHDDRLPNGDTETSHKLALSVPAKFYDKEFDYLWINTNGYISFEPLTEDVLASNFPFNEALLSPFMLDLDSTKQGNVFYRESNDIGVLIRATSDIRLAFPQAAADFDAESVFIVTWHDIEGRSLTGETASFTFQCIIVSNGRDTYAIFLYPENKMGNIPAGQKRKSTIFQARTGINQGRDHFLEMYPVDSLVNHRNTRSNGQWIFQIGGENVRENSDFAPPERVRHIKRQTSIINVQEVDLEEVDDDFSRPTVPPPRRTRDFCSRAQDACAAENSKCVNLQRGYCCKCLSGYFGNGRMCLVNDEPVRVNGNVSGVIDVRGEDGRIDRMTISEVGLHSYVITNEGRAYTAVSGVESKLGRALQPISAIGEIVGWLFASQSPSAPNGFQFTGGSFQRRVNVKYNEGGYRFSMTQRFLGVREENNVNVIIVDTKFVGMLPDINEDAAVRMDEYEEDYVKSAPGRLSSNSTRSYTVGNASYTYRVTQDIIYSECRDSMTGISDTLKLKAIGVFLNYQDTDHNVRYAMTTKIISPDVIPVPSHPCQAGSHGCHQNAECEPLEGQDFSCRCRPGFAGNGYVCEDVDECVRRPCPDHARCFNEPGSYACQCIDGYEMNRETRQCETEGGISPSNPCEATPDLCGFGTCYADGDSYRCDCPQGFEFKGGDCTDINECSEYNPCANDATCDNSVGSFSCRCNIGFSGDGYVCESIECPGNQIFSQCAGCFTTCEERSRPKPCTLICRLQCTCPDNTYLNGDMCVTADECPSEREPSQCEIEYAQVEELLRENPNLQDGPDLPSCMPDGKFAPKQCNDFTQVCWCVSQELGSVIPNTMTEEGLGNALSCEDPFHEEVVTGPCISKHTQVEEIHRQNPDLQDGPIYPTCSEDGFFVPRQCNGFTQACWCVETQTGKVIPNTMTLPDQGSSLVCEEDRGDDEVQLTSCQQQEVEAQELQSRRTARGPIFRPLCTEAGAYEPVQYHPNGYFMCVDVNGEEVSRHHTQPECLTQCQLQAYYAETDNALIGTTNFVPRCTDDGGYNTVQCDSSSRTCYCVNRNGEEIQGSRISTDDPGSVTDEILECARLDPDRQQNRGGAAQIVFAQSMGLNGVELPITSSSVAQRLYARSGHIAVGVGFDCSSQNIYWTDVATKAIYKAPISDINSLVKIIDRNMKSPEGIAIDFISGNMYWTDSGTDTIEVAKADGSNRAVLISSGLKNPRGIAVDPFGGQMYWTDWNRNNPAIMVANLDGSNPTVFVRDGLRLPNGISIDPFNRRLCFIDAGTKRVECMNLDGSNRAVAHDLSSSSSPGVKKPFALAIDGGRVYYTDRMSNRLFAINTATNDELSIPGPIGSHGHMYGVTIAHAQCSYGYNRCSRNNGGCSHLCLPIPNGRTCKCPDGNTSCIEQ